MNDIDQILSEKYKRNAHNRREELLDNLYKIINKYLGIILFLALLFAVCIISYFVYLYIDIVENTDKLQQAKGFIVPAVVLFLEKMKKKN